MATFFNPAAAAYKSCHNVSSGAAEAFHRSLPDYNVTALKAIPSLATELGLGAVFVKNESTRFGLPAFKILGASWGTVRAICAHGGVDIDTMTLRKVADYAHKSDIVLYAATEGNHGRAVARMGKLLGLSTRIFVPSFMSDETRKRIGSETGAEVVVVDGDYDVAVRKCWEAARDHSSGVGLQIQDNGFEGYSDTVPRWIVEGYATMLNEVEQQLAAQGLRADVVLTPIGVGSLGNAVVLHSKSADRQVAVVAVEPESAACLNASLRGNKETVVQTSHTICDGMNCGTVSPVSWPDLRVGIDVSVTVADKAVHEAVQYLHRQGIMAGPCGAAPLAALRKLVKEGSGHVELDQKSTVVILCTEGARGYPVPE